MSAGHGSGNHGRKAKKVPEEEHENHERWAVSYADMMTVLVGLFIVLYSMSQVDQVKFEALRQSLAAGFGTSAPAVMVGTDGAMVGEVATPITPELPAELPPELVTGPGFEEPPLATEGEVETLTPAERDLQAAIVELDRLEGIATQISAALAGQSLTDRVRFRVTERGLIIGMVADDVFFSAESADLTETAQRVIDTVAPVLAGLPEEVSVEGHANVLPVSGRYETNWELSADRATQVLRRLVEVGGVAPGRVGAVGFGDARPLEEAGGVTALEANRRVDLVILSAAPESVRGLLPSLAAAEQG
ncbi:flagellar motor protein MotB [Cellulomonas sp. KRMCY2]|uniref:flagellar motor protein MotB n=1 Tax=Cellulomonas sp. KRMCY2 TaxID=1304865 RepID=UPI00045EA5DE|nr:flagellar motor protein MotB [Cellulomonas sp. KRMCY2]